MKIKLHEGEHEKKVQEKGNVGKVGKKKVKKSVFNNTFKNTVQQKEMVSFGGGVGGGHVKYTHRR